MYRMQFLTSHPSNPSTCIEGLPPPYFPKWDGLGGVSLPRQRGCDQTRMKMQSVSASTRGPFTWYACPAKNEKKAKKN